MVNRENRVLIALDVCIVFAEEVDVTEDAINELRNIEKERAAAEEEAEAFEGSTSKKKKKKKKCGGNDSVVSSSHDEDAETRYVREQLLEAEQQRVDAQMAELQYRALHYCPV